jgi:sulfate permease
MMILAIFLAMNMGASGVSPAFSTLYGSGKIRKLWIPFVFGLMVLLGAWFNGGEVVETLSKEIMHTSGRGYLSAMVVLFTIGLTLMAANWIGVPQSTSQTTVMAISGTGLANGELNSSVLMTQIIPLWFLLPLVSFVVVYFIFRVFEFGKEKKGWFGGFMLFVVACYVAYSIGANNVANAAAPLMWVGYDNQLVLLAIGFGMGSWLMGMKGLESTSNGIVEVHSGQAVVIGIVVATLLLGASLIGGIPSSLVQLNAAGFIALSISRNGWRGTMGNEVVRKFFVVWAVAPVFSFLLSFLFTFIFLHYGLLQN